MEPETVDIDITNPSLELVKVAKYLFNDEDLVSKIAMTTFSKTESRGYEPGHEIQDWLEADSQILHK